MDNSLIEKEKNIIIDQIKRYVPEISSFFDLTLNLKDYSDKLYSFELPDIYKVRQLLIKEKIKNKIYSLFGDSIKDKIEKSLSGNLAINIADHHQVLNHPFIISSNVVSSIGNILQGKSDRYIIVISSGDVPPNNYFSLGGFQFHNKRVPLFSVSERECCSYFLEKRDFNFINKLKKIGRWKDFNSDDKNFLLLHQSYLDSLNLSSYKNYIDQISIVVNKTWPLLFDRCLRDGLPELVYITQEELVTECLLDLLKSKNFLSDTLFEEKFRNKILNNFRGNVVTWREQYKKGTHFFWRKHPTEPKSLRMYVSGDYLVPDDIRYKNLAIPLEKDCIINFLEKREIYPSLFMIFGTLNFYFGIKPLVGYGSVVYLNKMKKTWLETLSESDYSQEVQYIDKLNMNGFVAGLPLFFKRIDQKIRTLYACDLYFLGGVDREYLNRISEIKFKDLLNTGIADIYDYYSSKYVPTGEVIKRQINFDNLSELTLPWL